MLLEAIFALEKLSASRAGMRSESLVFASLSSYRVQQVNAKLGGCGGPPVVQLRDDVCVGTWYMRRFVEPLELFVGAQVRERRRVLYKGLKVVGHLGARGSTVFSEPEGGQAHCQSLQYLSRRVVNFD
jgi:hypothetical protein